MKFFCNSRATESRYRSRLPRSTEKKVSLQAAGQACMKIYADENNEASIIEGLRKRRITVHSAVELGYRGRSDEFHLAKAEELETVVRLLKKSFSRLCEP